MTSIKTTGDLAHLMFCALVALHLARQDGQMMNSDSENRFLVDWLATAQRQQRFAKHMDTDIRWLQAVGRHQGGLVSTLTSLWVLSTGSLVLTHSAPEGSLL
ncbi:DUF2913 family protein [Budvicia aquatica]|uniref:DUF2913 domain-containing protein n=1 Tax=Budvicia aquatica TaxID=82979 RepID=A0A2C6CR75_9GAMM|nr:DUF2913 family protein [Budvicia aquatica]PHI29179.1 DUF2913 domain-containing protein [Budvicia aquatica]VFS47369.1 Protein of uncharacterised function (DUF2913) [Budvicia aquatica]